MVPGIGLRGCSMIWQDILIALGSVGFTIALVPAILGKSKPPKSTCLLTSGILYSYVLAFATLGLWYSAVTTVSTAACWTVLLVQGAMKDRV